MWLTIIPSLIIGAIAVGTSIMIHNIQFGGGGEKNNNNNISKYIATQIGLMNSHNINNDENNKNKINNDDDDDIVEIKEEEEEEEIIYVIGDLHGDDYCAKYWVYDKLELVVVDDDDDDNNDDNYNNNNINEEHDVVVVKNDNNKNNNDDNDDNDRNKNNNIQMTTSSSNSTSSSSSRSRSSSSSTRTTLRNTRWSNPNVTLLFMGDYIDKGPYSKQTLEFVMSLRNRFPNNVIALMGNHEMELLKDRYKKRGSSRRRSDSTSSDSDDDSDDDSDSYSFYYQMPYATAHPLEYLNYIQEQRTLDSNDQIVMDQLLQLSMEIYAHNLVRYVRFIPTSSSSSSSSSSSRKSNKKKKMVQSIVDLVQDESLRSLVSERLKEYQDAYIAAYQPNTTLGQFLQSLKVVHYQANTLFTHGGLFPEAVSLFGTTTTTTADAETETDTPASMMEAAVERINARVYQHASHSGKEFINFMEQNALGRYIQKMLEYRGNHNDCISTQNTLSNILDGNIVQRLVVGHTPGRNVRILCGGNQYNNNNNNDNKQQQQQQQKQFIAADSLLGRYIRTSGNQYCDITKDYITTSTNGMFTCPIIPKQCQGQIVKIITTTTITTSSSSQTVQKEQQQRRRQKVEIIDA